MNHFLFSAVLIFLLALPVSFYFISKPGARRYFGFFWFAVAFWTFFVGFQFPIIERISAGTWGWWLHIGCISVPIVFYHFSLIWTGNPKRSLLRVGYGLFLAFVLLNTLTDLFTGKSEFRIFYHYPKPSILYPLYILYFQVYGILATWQIFELRKQIFASGRKLLYLFLGVHLLAWVGAMDNYLIMYDKLIFPLYPYGLYLIFAYLLVGSWAFSKIHASNSAPQKV